MTLASDSGFPSIDEASKPTTVLLLVGIGVLDAAIGETNWQTHLSDDGIAAPVVTDETVLTTTSDVLAFRRDAGGIFGPDRERWQSSSITASTYSSPVVAAGRVFVTGSRGLLALWSGEGG